MALPEVIVEARDGAEIRFKLPVDSGKLEKRSGHSVEIDVGGLCFDVIIANPIRLPLTCSSFQEARELAMSVSLQVMSAVLQPAADHLIVPAEDLSLVPRLAEDETVAGMAPADPSPQVVDQGATDLSFKALFAAWREAHLAAGGAPTTPPHLAGSRRSIRDLSGS